MHITVAPLLAHWTVQDVQVGGRGPSARPLDTRRVSKPDRGPVWTCPSMGQGEFGEVYSSHQPKQINDSTYKMNFNKSHNQRLIYSFQSKFMEVIKSSLPLVSNTPSRGPSATSRNFSVQSSPGFHLRSSYQS